MPKLHVIQGSPPPDTPKQRVVKRLNASKPAEMLQCQRCAGREFIETRIGVVIKNGKPSGGTKALLCACCLLKGERVVVA